MKAISAANGQAAHSVSRASAQAAHDAAMLDAMEDWNGAISTATLNSLVTSSNATRDYTNSLTEHWANWSVATAGKAGEAPTTAQASMVDSIIGILIHPIWSHDRQDWIPLGELLPGECLDGEDELVYVQALEILERSVSVFNIEVQHEHMYRVGEFGILVHNSDECLPFWRVFENLEFDYLNKLYGTGTFFKNPVNRGIDFVSDRLQLAIDAKAWGNMAWYIRSLYPSGALRNQKMLLRLETQVDNHMASSTHNLRLDFAWDIPEQVLETLSKLKKFYGDRFDFQDNMLRKMRQK